MSLRVTGLAGLAVFSVASAIAVDSASAETIYSALAAAYNSNSTLNAQRAATRSADETLPQAKAGYRPTVFFNADASASRNVSSGTVAGTTATSLTPFGFGVTINQSLFNGFRTLNSVRAAEAGVRASRERLRNIEQDTLFNAATAYADVILAQELVSIRKKNISFLREQVNSSQARLDVGEGTRTDLAQSQAQLAFGRAQLSAAIANLEANKATYRQIVGRDPANLATPRGPVRLYPASLTQAITFGTVQHPAVRATQHIVDAAAFNVKVVEGELLPTVGLQGSVRQTYNNSVQGSRNSNATATLNLNVPIYQAGQVSARVRENKEILSQRRIEVDQSRDQVRNSIVAAWSQLQSARANIVSNRAQVKAARLALEGVIEERNVGQRTQLDVLQTQNQVLDAQELLVQSQRNVIVAGYALVSATGRLNSRRLGLQVAHYSPKAHYKKTVDRWYGLRTPDKR